MPSQKGESLVKFTTIASTATSTRSFHDKFEKHCRLVDRHRMTRSLLQLKEIKHFIPEESYQGKDNKEAQKIYDASRTIIKHTGERGILLKVSFLTKALFAAEPKNSLYAQLILDRARCWYCLGFLTRCIKDCDYLINLSIPSESINDETNEWNDRKTESTILKSKCSERLKRTSKTSQKQSRVNSTPFGICTLPKVDGKPNVKLKSCSDAVALAYDKKRGRHLVAARNIKTGSVLIVDDPFSFSTDCRALQTNCLHCHVSLKLEDNVSLPCESCRTVAYCSDICRQESWNNYHKYECTIFDYFYENNLRDDNIAHEQRSHFLLAWRTTVARAIDKATNWIDKEFSELQKSKTNEEKGCREIDATIEPYDPLDYRTVLALETHCRDSTCGVNLAKSLKAVFLAKCLGYILGKMNDKDMEEEELCLVAVGMMRHIQAVDCNAYEIVENSRDDTTKIWEPQNVGGAIYTTVSLVNHGCYPNVVRHSYPGGKVVVRALRFISKGSDLLDCYGPHFITDEFSSRNRYLQEKYHFACSCEACFYNWRLPEERTTAYRCPCGTTVRDSAAQCQNCNNNIDIWKMESQVLKSVKKRVNAIPKMFEGNYTEALPHLLEHAATIDKILAVPSLEAIKTQQSIIQCYNSLSSVRPSDHIANCTRHREVCDINDLPI